MTLNTQLNNQNGKTTIGQFIITKIINIKGNLHLTKAAKLMIKNKIGSVLVDLGRDKYSILTKTDIINVLSQDKDPNSVLISEVVENKELITCFPEDLLEDAMLKMAKHKIEKLLVIDPKTDKLLGIISSSDILRIAPGLLEIKREQEFLTEASQSSESLFTGYCDSCSNFDENLQEIGGFALCKRCITEKEDLIEDISLDDETM
ncbi:MAG: CBS domain-containing protein [Candidatus Hodarchaeales archaeon]|jgi:CBS domain-containing protein